ncbi:hypothetical protein M4914_12095 [Streptomyces somaliensis DSM 40738]|nr:hypothetical protein [Streptomyces somaliensis]MCQ0023614.1 hypothetical protein [Streptomyces somaliensis DSM 40738]
MSPEQVQGRPDLDGRSDLYSVGVLLFHMLAGRLPFEADSGYALGYLHVTTPPPTLASLGVTAAPAAEAVLARALAKDPALRYPDAEEMREALRHAAEAVPARQSTAVPPRPPQPRRSRSPTAPPRTARPPTARPRTARLPTIRLRTVPLPTARPPTARLPTARSPPVRPPASVNCSSPRSSPCSSGCWGGRGT